MATLASSILRSSPCRSKSRTFLRYVARLSEPCGREQTMQDLQDFKQLPFRTTASSDCPRRLSLSITFGFRSDSSSTSMHGRPLEHLGIQQAAPTRMEDHLGLPASKLAIPSHQANAPIADSEACEHASAQHAVLLQEQAPSSSPAPRCWQTANMQRSARFSTTRDTSERRSCMALSSWRGAKPCRGNVNP